MDININDFYKKFCDKYELLYNKKVKRPDYTKVVNAGDLFVENHPEFVREFNIYRGDILSSDREIAAFYLTLKDIGALNAENLVFCGKDEPNLCEAAFKGDKIYTHDVATQILELFDDLLCERNIKVPSPEDDEREEDNESALYGSTYGELMDNVEAVLIEMLNKAGVTDYIQNVFSGNY